MLSFWSRQLPAEDGQEPEQLRAYEVVAIRSTMSLFHRSRKVESWYKSQDLHWKVIEGLVPACRITHVSYRLCLALLHGGHGNVDRFALALVVIDRIAFNIQDILGVIDCLCNRRDCAREVMRLRLKQPM
jgi:hypothetical protein